jgi:hypothetical protein
LGLVGGLIANLLLAGLAYVTAWIYIDFKLRYMGCMNVADAGTIMFGRIGGIIFGVGIMIKVSPDKIRDLHLSLTSSLISCTCDLQSVGLAASHALAGEIALSSISNDAVCKVAFTAIICVVSVLVSQFHNTWRISRISTHYWPILALSSETFW